MKTLTISLPDTVAAAIERDFAYYGYADSDAYVADALRARQEEEQEVLTSLLLDGVNSGDPIPATPEFWADLRAHTDALIAEHQMDPSKVTAAA